MAKIEVHFHTDESSICGKVPAAKGVAAYKRGGYDGIMVTDHFSKQTLGGKADGKDWNEIKEHVLKGYRAAKKAGEELGVRIYLGLEIRFPENDNDYLLFGLEEGFLDRHPWAYETTPEKFYQVVKEENLCIIQAHPFRIGCEPGNPAYLDGAEYFNAHPNHNSRNSEAQKWIMQIREHGGPDGGERAFAATVGSDYHQESDFSGTGLIFDHLPADEQELKELILAGAYRMDIPNDRN